MKRNALARLNEGVEKARHARTTQEFATVYNRYRSASAYRFLAKNPHTNAATLEKLSAVHARMSAMAKMNVDRTVLLIALPAHELARYKQRREVITTNDYAFISTLRAVRVKDIFDVLLAVAEHANTTTQALENVFTTPNLWVENPTRKNVSRTAQAQLLQALLRHPSTPSALLPRMKMMLRSRTIETAAPEAGIVLPPQPPAKSQPQLKVVRVPHMSFEDELDAEFAAALGE